MHSLDKRILQHVLDRAIARGAYVTVHDGEDFCLTFTQDTDKVFAMLESTEMDYVYFTKTDQGVVSFGENRLGYLVLVHGNEPGVIISDYSDSEFINGILKGAPTK